MAGRAACPPKLAIPGSKRASAARTAAQLWDLPAGKAGTSTPVAIATLLPHAPSSYPSWSDAAVCLSVQRTVQELVQPQIERLAEQIAMLAGSAQSDLREVERLTERWEVRAEGRFAGIESRLAMLVEGAARTEEREKDLNQKVAGVAEDLIRHGYVPRPEQAAPSTSPRFEDVDQKLREVGLQMTQLGETVSKTTARVQSLEEGLDEFQATWRNEMADIDQTHGQLRDLCANLQEDVSRQVTEDLLGRLEYVEEQVCSLGVALEDAPVQAALQSIEDLQAESKERHDELRRHVTEACRKMTASFAKESDQKALAIRIDDVTQRLTALKVKTETLDGRFAAFGERMDVTREIEVRGHAYTATDFTERLEDVEQRLAALSENCEEFVEQALENRLAALAEALPPPLTSTTTIRPSCSRRLQGPAEPITRMGTPSRPTARGDLLAETEPETME